MCKKYLIAIPLLLWSPLGFSQWIEYGHFSDTEEQEINGPRYVGSEYESDRLTYQFLSSWDQQWVNETNPFQYTAGSLGPTRFYNRGRLRLLKPIGDWLDFKLSYVEMGDYKFHRQSLLFEFILKPTKHFHFSVYGQPSTLKKQDDIGVASIVNFSDQSSLRLFLTAVNFSYNKRNESSDRYTKQPYAWGGVWRLLEQSTSEFIEVGFRKDTMQNKMSDQLLIYQYGAEVALLKGRRALTAESLQFLQTEVNYFSSDETNTQDSDQGIVRWKNRSFDALVQFEQLAHWFQMVGIRYNHSHWESASGNVVHNNVLPHAWMNVYRTPETTISQNIDLGYEFTWHQGRGPAAIRSTLDSRYRIEHRMNVRYGLRTSEKNQLNLLLTFDIDRFGSGETWEGGAMQFSTSF